MQREQHDFKKCRSEDPAVTEDLPLDDHLLLFQQALAGFDQSVPLARLGVSGGVHGRILTHQLQERDKNHVAVGGVQRSCKETMSKSNNSIK